MRRAFSFCVVLLWICILYGCSARNESSQKTYKEHEEGIFKITMSSDFVKITDSRLDELRKLMIEGGQTLAESSKSADPKEISEKQFSFLSAYEIPKKDVVITLMGMRNTDVVTQDEMYKTNKQRIEWGINSGQLSKDSKGVSKLIIDGVPCLLMDIKTMSGGRLLTYSCFVPMHNTYTFQIGISAPKNYFEENDPEIKSIINSVKIVR